MLGRQLIIADCLLCTCPVCLWRLQEPAAAAKPAVQVSAGQVKQLRDKSGAGMMDCKKALSECGGDVEVGVGLCCCSGNNMHMGCMVAACIFSATGVCHVLFWRS